MAQFTSDGAELVALQTAKGGAERPRLYFRYRPDEDKKVAEFPFEPPIALSRKHPWVATRSPHDNGVAIWDGNTGRQRKVLPLQDTPTAIAISDSGRTLAIADNSRLQVFEIRSGGPVASADKRVKQLWFRGEDQILAVEEEKTELLSVRRLETERTIDRAIRAAELSLDGRLLFALTSTEGGPRCTCQLFDLNTGDILFEAPGYASDPVFGLGKFSTDNRYIAAMDGASIRLIDVQRSREKVVLRGHTDRVRSVAFAPDHRTLVSVGGAGLIMLWDLETGQEITTLYEDTMLFTLAVSAEGRLFSANGENQWLFW